MLGSGPLVVLLWKSRRECSCSGPSAGIARIDVIVEHMNYKCRPVALDLEQTIDVRAGVANACRGALPILWIKFLLGNKYLMH